MLLFVSCSNEQRKPTASSKPFQEDSSKKSLTKTEELTEKKVNEDDTDNQKNTILDDIDNLNEGLIAYQADLTDLPDASSGFSLNRVCKNVYSVNYKAESGFNSIMFFQLGKKKPVHFRFGEESRNDWNDVYYRFENGMFIVRFDFMDDIMAIHRQCYMLDFDDGSATNLNNTEVADKDFENVSFSGQLEKDIGKHIDTTDPKDTIPVDIVNAIIEKNRIPQADGFQVKNVFHKYKENYLMLTLERSDCADLYGDYILKRFAVINGSTLKDESCQYSINDYSKCLCILVIHGSILVTYNKYVSGEPEILFNLDNCLQLSCFTKYQVIGVYDGYIVAFAQLNNGSKKLVILNSRFGDKPKK